MTIMTSFFRKIFIIYIIIEYILGHFLGVTIFFTTHSNMCMCIFYIDAKLKWALLNICVLFVEREWEFSYCSIVNYGKKVIMWRIDGYIGRAWWVRAMFSGQWGDPLENWIGGEVPARAKADSDPAVRCIATSPPRSNLSFHSSVLSWGEIELVIFSLIYYSWLGFFGHIESSGYSFLIMLFAFHWDFQEVVNTFVLPISQTSRHPDFMSYH